MDIDYSKSDDLAGFSMGFPGKLKGAIRVLKGALGMPVTRLVVALFVVFGRGPMGVSSKFVLFGGSPVGFVHGGVLSWGPLTRGPPTIL